MLGISQIGRQYTRGQSNADIQLGELEVFQCWQLQSICPAYNCDFSAMNKETLRPFIGPQMGS